MLKKIIAALVLSAAVCPSAYAYTGVSDWAKEALDAAYESQLVPGGLYEADVSGAITKGECASLCVRFYEAHKNTELTPAANPFGDNVSDDVLKAVSAGITGAFGGSTFDEQAEATREEIADMLARTYAAVTGEEIYTEDKELFADDGEISQWARESVYFIQDKSIINIVGSNKFAPQRSGMTIQSALIAAYKMNELTGNAPEPEPGEDEKTTGEICLEMIPAINFGTQEEPVVNEESAVIVVNDATQADYNSYIETAKRLFPTFVYELPGQNYKAANGNYIINVTYLNGVFSAEVLTN